MINRDEYTDDEWIEFIARSWMLTKDHQWVAGDDCWDKKAQLVFVVYEVNQNAMIRMSDGEWDWDLTPKRRPLIDFNRITWLPSLSQIVRHKQWDTQWDVRFYDDDWRVGSLSADTTFGRAPIPELAALRAMQRCEHTCEHTEGVLVVRGRIDRAHANPDGSDDLTCSGIHTDLCCVKSHPDQYTKSPDHQCIGHVLAELKDAV